MITTKQNNFVINHIFSPNRLNCGFVEFSSVIRRKPYIFGANQNRNRVNLSVAKDITHLFHRKLTAPTRTMVKRLNKPFGGPDRFPALAPCHPRAKMKTY